MIESSNSIPSVFVSVTNKRDRQRFPPYNAFDSTLVLVVVDVVDLGHDNKWDIH
jgi:hypothetical protein